jgi:hydroxyacylglutathione hydrolase
MRGLRVRRAALFTPSRYEYLGMFDHLVPPTFNVTEWVKPGTTIDLGGRVLRVLHVPGHTQQLSRFV